jgi:hypothetical protein
MRISNDAAPIIICVAAMLCCAVFPGMVRGELSPSEMERHLSEGEESFRRAMELDRTDPETALDYYRSSIMHFERITGAGGVRNGKLFYNLGNAYFRKGDIGRAILNYRRAALYMPHDPNLRLNLEFARGRRVDSIEQNQREKVFETLFFLHYDIPSRIRLAVFSYAFALVWVFAALLLFVKRGGIRPALVVTALVSAIFLTSLIVESVSFRRKPPGVIVSGEVIARKGDAETYEPSFTEPLHAGTEFTLLTRRTGWWHVELENGSRCWLPAGSGELVLD